MQFCNVVGVDSLAVSGICLQGRVDLRPARGAEDWPELALPGPPAAPAPLRRCRGNVQAPASEGSPQNVSGIAPAQPNLVAVFTA